MKSYISIYNPNYQSNGHEYHKSVRQVNEMLKIVYLLVHLRI
jgi:hypothetical protein